MLYLDPVPKCEEIRSHPVVVLMAVLDNTLCRMVDSLIATHPELERFPRPKEGPVHRADILIGQIWGLQESLRKYRFALRKGQDSLSESTSEIPKDRSPS